MESVLSEALECPVCLEVPKSSPVYQCQANGHVVCRACIPHLKEVCPVCRQRGFTRCLSAEKLIAAWQNLSNQPLALRQISSQPGRERSTRLVFCPVAGCETVVPVDQLETQHLPERHEEMSPVSYESGPQVYRLFVRPEVWCGSARFDPVWVTLNGFNVFRQVMRDNEKKTWFFWVCIEPRGDRLTRAEVEFKFLNQRGQIVFQHTTAAVPLDIHPLQVLSQYRGLFLPDDFMQTRIVEQGQFSLTFNVTHISVV